MVLKGSQRQQTINNPNAARLKHKILPHERDIDSEVVILVTSIKKDVRKKQRKRLNVVQLKSAAVFWTLICLYRKTDG